MCLDPGSEEFVLLMLMPSSPVSMSESRSTTLLHESGSNLRQVQQVKRAKNELFNATAANEITDSVTTANDKSHSAYGPVCVRGEAWVEDLYVVREHTVAKGRVEGPRR